MTSSAPLARGSWWSWTEENGWVEHYTPRPGIDVCFHNQCPWCFLRVRHGCSGREAYEGYVQAFNRFVQAQPATYHEAELLYLAWSEIVHLSTVLANWHPRDGYRTVELSNRIVLLPHDDRFTPTSSANSRIPDVATARRVASTFYTIGASCERSGTFRRGHSCR
jgi:hypothetical protein